MTGSAFAQQSQQKKRPDFNELASSIKVQTGATLLKAENGVPRLVMGTRGSALVAAHPKLMTASMIAERSRDFFAATGSSIGFLPASAELTAVPAIAVGQSYNTVLTLSYNGIPVRDRKAHVAIGMQSGELLALRNNLPNVEPAHSTPKLSTQNILDKIAPTLMESSRVSKQPSLVYLAARDNSVIRLAYEVRVSEPAHYWRYTFDAMTGTLLEKKDLVVECGNHSHDHSGETAHDHSAKNVDETKNPFFDPVVLLDQRPLLAEPAAAVTGKVKANVLFHSPFREDTTVDLGYVKVTVNGKTTYADKNGNFSVNDVTYPLAITSSLESRYFRIDRQDGPDAVLTSTVTSGLANLDWLTSTGLMAERSAFSSVHRVYQHVKSYDESFTELDDQMTVNVNVGGGFCNAYYLPDEETLNFYPQSAECSNTAEIADVVYHEYGHHYHHIRYRERGTQVVSGALGEAFADILSNFLRDNSVIGEGFRGTGTILRNSKNTFKWPTGVAPDPHTTGQILTGAIWDLRLAIGLERSAYLFHEALKAVPDASNNGDTEDDVLEAFTDVLIAYLLADDDDANLANGTPNSTQIISAFEKHGIGLSNLVSLNVSTIADQDTVAVAYPVNVQASYAGILGDIDQDSVKLYYSVNNGPFVMVNAAHETGDRYNTSIPKVKAGSTVRYYSTARTTIENGGLVRSPREGFHTFLVGYRRVHSDDAELELDHEYGVDNDDASSGIWERGIPMGTLWTEEFFQQDSDHTAKGEYAYITGNLNAQSGSTDPLEDALFDFNDQTSVRTTLETSTFSLSGLKAPVLKFWYYHNSQQVFSPSNNTFRVTISTNNGTSWRTIYTSQDVYKGWTQVIEPITLGQTANDQIKLRFVATAVFGTIVEAGVDDIEVLEPMMPIAASVGDNLAFTFDVSTYPNPSTNGSFRFTYSLPEATIVKAELKNVMGRTVWSTNGELKQMGAHSENVSVDLPSGTYWLQLSTSMGNAYKQVHVVK